MNCRCGQRTQKDPDQNLLIPALLSGAAGVLFPVFLHSTLDSKYAPTAYNSSASEHSLVVAMIWWPFAFVVSLTYAAFISRRYRGKVQSSVDVY